MYEILEELIEICFKKKIIFNQIGFVVDRLTKSTACHSDSQKQLRH